MVNPLRLQERNQRERDDYERRWQAAYESGTDYQRKWGKGIKVSDGGCVISYGLRPVRDGECQCRALWSCSIVDETGPPTSVGGAVAWHRQGI